MRRQLSTALFRLLGALARLRMQAALLRFLETGELPDGDKTAGSMRRVITNTSQLSPEDRAAMAEYLKSLPPVQGPTPPKKEMKDDHKS